MNNAVDDLQVGDRVTNVLVGIIELLSKAVEAMEAMIEKPQFLAPDTPKARFRYENPNAYIFQVLMCVRIASGLRAANILLLNHHTTEMGVLFRTIDDFCSQIMFVDEIIEKGPENVTASQREFLEHYFQDDDLTAEEKFEESVNPKRKFNYNAGRQKIQASEARTFGGNNPHHMKKIVKTIDDTLSGTVHGEYASVMEMYGGNPPSFHMEGIPARFSEYREYLTLQVHMALNAFFKVAYNLGHQELANSLRELRRKFEVSAAYAGAKATLPTYLEPTSR